MQQLGLNISPSYIFNLDETALTTVHVPPKIIAQKGQKQVGQATSGERGTLVTACCIVAADGRSIPPFLIFPRVNFVAKMLDKAPTGKINNNIYKCAKNFLFFKFEFFRHRGNSIQIRVDDK